MRKRKADLNCADLFAGGGGFSTGVARACRKLDKTPDLVAVNHWEVAIETHRRNHPWARHLCTGLDAVIPTKEVPKGRLNLLVASPECTHHSSARGGRPCSDQSRASAWLVLKWLQELYVEAFVIENVHEFTDWGPLGADGRPLKRLRGALFDQFISSLKALGYNVDWRVLNAADYGGATTRERLFIIGRRGGNKRILWPEATHSRVGDIQPDLFGDKQRWRPAREIIDWSMPSQSIFTRKRPLAPSTVERIAAGLQKFGGQYAEPFLVVLRRHADARSIHEPIPTLTAGGQHIGLAQPFLVEYRGNHAGREDGHRRVASLDNPLPTQDTSNRFGLCQPFIISAGGPVGQGRNAKSIDEPMPTVLTDDHHALIQPFIMSMEHSRGKNAQPFMIPVNHGTTKDGGRRVYDIDQPMPTITTVDAWGMVQPFLVSYYGTQNMSPVTDPVPTVTTKDRFGLVTVDGYALDIHFRMLHYRELARAMGFDDSYEFAGTREEKVKQIGNAVECNTAEAVAMAAVAA